MNTDDEPCTQDDIDRIRDTAERRATFLLWLAERLADWPKEPLTIHVVHAAAAELRQLAER